MTRGASRIARWLLPLAFLCLYALTAQRGVSWQDSGDYQLRTLYRDIYGFNGLASAHPLYIVFTHFFAFCMELLFGIEVPCATTLASAFWMSLALSMFFCCARRLSRSLPAALLATLTLGLSHLAWWLSTVAEVYAMTLFFLFWEMSCVVRILQGERTRGLFIQAAAASGFGFAVHNFALLSLPAGVLALAWASLGGGRPRVASLPRILLRVLGLLAVWCAAAWPIVGHALGQVLIGVSPAAVVSDVLFGNYAPQVTGSETVSMALTLANFGIAALSISSVCWIVGAVSFIRNVREWRDAGRRIVRSPEMIYVLAVFAVHAAFGLRYRVADQVHFLLPTLALSILMLAPLMASSRAPLPVSGGHRRLAVAALAIATVFGAVAVPVAANAALHMPQLWRRALASRGRLLPYRDEISYWAIPWKSNERSAELFAADVIAKMDAMPDAMLYSDSTASPPILLRSGSATKNWSIYTQWNDTSRFISAAKEGQTVYAISPVRSYCPDAALATGNVKPLFP